MKGIENFITELYDDNEIVNEGASNKVIKREEQIKFINSNKSKTCSEMKTYLTKRISELKKKYSDLPWNVKFYSNDAKVPSAIKHNMTTDTKNKKLDSFIIFHCQLFDNSVLKPDGDYNEKYKDVEKVMNELNMSKDFEKIFDTMSNPYLNKNIFMSVGYEPNNVIIILELR